MSGNPVVQTTDLTISFGGNVAVNRVNLEVEEFTLKSIIGPNGAGKTTLFNLISGQYKPTSGRVLFKGRDLTRLGAAERTALGVGRSFQLTNIFPLLTVLENVRLALQSKARLGLNFWSPFQKFTDLEDRAYELLKRVMLHRNGPTRPPP